MIDVLQGALGSGKSAAATSIALDHIRRGGVVAANFSLVDGWADSIASKHIFSFFSDDYRYKTACSYWKRFYRIDGIDAVRKINPREESTGIYEKRKNGFSEGHGLLIIDEAHMFMNTRDSMKRSSVNRDWISFLTQSRKLGWNVILIAHTIDMIDSQVRCLCEYESRFRNLNKVNLPLLPIPMCPFPLFFVIKRYAGLGAGSGAIAERKLFPLPYYAARLYDSLEVFSTDSDSAANSPLLCGAPPAPPLGGGVGGVPARVKRSALIGVYWDDYTKTGAYDHISLNSPNPV